MWLDYLTFKTVIASTPLVSIDLIVLNPEHHVLLGQRVNRPAQGYWFVPGGRILKNEAMDDAFQRITLGELGASLNRSYATLLGIYEHFYPDSVFSSTSATIDTHYIVHAYLFRLSAKNEIKPPQDQHSLYRWWPINDIQASQAVHGYTRAYMNELSHRLKLS